MLSSFLLLERLQVACDRFFRPPGNGVSHYILHTGNMLCVTTPTARDFQSTYSSNSWLEKRVCYVILHIGSSTTLLPPCPLSTGLELMAVSACLEKRLVSRMYAVLNMPLSSSRLIVIASLPFVSIRFRNSSDIWGFRLYLQYACSSEQKPQTAVKFASE